MSSSGLGALAACFSRQSSRWAADGYLLVGTRPGGLKDSELLNLDLFGGARFFDRHFRVRISSTPAAPQALAATTALRPVYLDFEASNSFLRLVVNTLGSLFRSDRDRVLLCPTFAGLFEDICVLEFARIVGLNYHTNPVERVLQCFS